ncbi:MAG: ATP-dependent helicase [Chloroflexi bacterium]|nr:ATP-dependent helicase [Chloroflexota bacterium]
MRTSVDTPTIEELWQEAEFAPNERQEEAIRHVEGALYLTAGPGSGKTRVLLWRTLNLIVYEHVKPEEIYLATFTEKAAFQLQEGLRALLGLVTNRTGVSYDLGRMYVGTVHSLCQRMLADRKFMISRQRTPRIRLMDELSQYFYLMNGGNWARLTDHLGIDQDRVIEYINTMFVSGNGTPSLSKHEAVSNCIAFFNRMAEENLDHDEAIRQADARRVPNPRRIQNLIGLCRGYGNELHNGNVVLTDFSLLQREALMLIQGNAAANRVFRHVIVDEYQDTNTIQEQLFFALAGGHKNICVVGDDDQALYRFRGATVENFVQFPQRCRDYLAVDPTTIPLVRNYRSREQIVGFYNQFMERCDWTEGRSTYRVNKTIAAQRTDDGVSVVVSGGDNAEDAYEEIAALVQELIDTGKVKDPNQIAFLFPSLKSVHVQRAIDALARVGIPVYAPRAGRFLEVDEAKDVFGLFVRVFGKPQRGAFPGMDYNNFHNWLDEIDDRGRDLLAADADMAEFVKVRRAQLDVAANDYQALLTVVQRNGWVMTAPYDIDVMKRPLYNAPGLSDQGKRALANQNFENAVKSRLRRGQAPFTLDYALKRATSIDWSVLDLFYRLSGFRHFKAMYDLAERGEDEAPICNLGLITQYLARFMDEYLPLIPAPRILDGSFVRLLFGSYLYALYRRGEAEYEDANDPFPKGRIPFLTIHQSKGLEFPVVVLGSLYKQNRGAPQIERMMRPLLSRASEPIDRVQEFDIMRMFYVALSRAKNLLIITNFKGQQSIKPFKTLLSNPAIPRIPAFNVNTVPEADDEDKALPRNYSFTSDYLLYQKCPRQYMFFNKYGFVASRSQTMFFGSLVHRTLEDLHQHLIARRQPL